MGKTSNKKAPGKGSRFPLQLTRKQLFLWLGIAFLAMAWMFILGIIVGRGLSPVRFDLQKLKKELIVLKGEALKKERARFKIGIDNPTGKSDLDFYEILTDKKEEARSKFAKARKARKKSAKGPAKPPKRSEVNKTGWQGLLTIQVASFKSAETARQMAVSLKRKGYDAYVVTVNVPEKGPYHRVRVGHFQDSSEAGREAVRLKQEKLEAIIVRE
ncbi:MAG: SPOR domain-containing protein [Deltaproteobacteria bacterium]|nr:SPOR domain-containing protein [Deltaproteobacteria bacterium]MBW2018762.1 SPOR domain-containing protein [Deltaproteobacteria bacterium]MBW2073491.1 SPOR domain-containing protein [Deltaproteobacteria bacterium]RLB83005.1 MAG: hypothetical protein DRH17_03630 [Deltaproteobacteria bacterium]